MSRPATPPQRSGDQLLWVYVDHDNTMAEALWTPDNQTSAIGEPIWENLEKLRRLVEAGYKPWIYTSRPGWDYETIETWYEHYGVKLKGIHTGKPLGAAYIDDRAVAADEPDWLAAVRRINGG